MKRNDELICELGAARAALLFKDDRISDLERENELLETQLDQAASDFSALRSRCLACDASLRHMRYATFGCLSLTIMSTFLTMMCVCL